MAEVGGADHAILADESDATYMQSAAPGQSVSVTFDDPTLPAGAAVASVRARFRQSHSDPGYTYWYVTLREGDGTIRQNQYFPATGTITTMSGAAVSYAPPATGVNDLQMIVLTTVGATGRVYEAYIDVTYAEKPEVTVTAPAGTVTGTNMPQIAWTTVLDSDGGPQTHYEVKVFTDAQYGAGGFDPGASTPFASGSAGGTGVDAAAALSVTLPTVLPDDTYRAYVRVAQTVAGSQHWSDWEYSGFVIDVLTPDAPSVVLTPEASAGRVKVAVDDAGAVSTDRYELERSDDGGVSWVPVRTVDGDTGVLEGTGAQVVYDYEAPNGVEVTYRVRSLHDYSGVFAAGPWSEASTTWVSAAWWIKHPHDPSLNMVLAGKMFSYADVARPARRGVFQPLGSASAVVVSDTRAPEQGTVVVQLDDREDVETLNVLLDTLDPLLLQGPAVDGHPDRWVSIADQSGARVIDKSWVHMTRESLPWLLVPRPDGAVTGADYVASVDDEELVVSG